VTPSPESVPVELSDVDTPPPSQNRPRASGKTPATTVVGRNIDVVKSIASSIDVNVDVSCVAPSAAGRAQS